MSEIGWADGGPKSNPYVKGGKGQARILTRALTAYQRRSEACTSAGCSGTRGATRRAATRSASGAGTRACGRRTGPRSRLGGPSSASPAGDVRSPARGGSDLDPRRGLRAAPRRNGAGGAEELLRRRPAGAARGRRLHAHGLRARRAASGAAVLGGDRSRPGDWRRGLVRVRRGRRRRRPRGRAHAAVRVRHAELGARARRSDVSSRTLPALPAEGRASAGGVERLPRRRRRPLRPEGSFWSEHPELPALPIRAWQIWNEQNSPTFFAPKPSVRAYARMLTRPTRRSPAVIRGPR